MQRVTVICVGKLKERFYIDAAAEYAKRLSRYCRLELLELPEQRLPEDLPAPRWNGASPPRTGRPVPPLRAASRGWPPPPGTEPGQPPAEVARADRKSTRLNSSHIA